MPDFQEQRAAPDPEPACRGPRVLADPRPAPRLSRPPRPQPWLPLLVLAAGLRRASEHGFDRHGRAPGAPSPDRGGSGFGRLGRRFSDSRRLVGGSVFRVRVPGRLVARFLGAGRSSSDSGPGSEPLVGTSIDPASIRFVSSLASVTSVEASTAGDVGSPAPQTGRSFSFNPEFRARPHGCPRAEFTCSSSSAPKQLQAQNPFLAAVQPLADEPEPAPSKVIGTQRGPRSRDIISRRLRPSRSPKPCSGTATVNQSTNGCCHRFEGATGEAARPEAACSLTGETSWYLRDAAGRRDRLRPPQRHPPLGLRSCPQPAAGPAGHTEASGRSPTLPFPLETRARTGAEGRPWLVPLAVGNVQFSQRHVSAGWRDSSMADPRPGSEDAKERVVELSRLFPGTRTGGAIFTLKFGSSIPLAPVLCQASQPFRFRPLPSGCG